MSSIKPSPCIVVQQDGTVTVNPPALDCGAGSPVRRVSAGAAVGLLLALVAGAPACAVRTWSHSSSPRPISPEVQEALSEAGSEWAAVEAIAAGAQLEVRLRAAAPPDDRTVEAPPARLALRPLRRRAAALQDTLQDSRIVKGRFHAAAADTLTLALEDGCRHQWNRRAVRQVKIRRPFLARPAGWIAFGIGTAIVLPLLFPLEDLSGGAVPLILSYTAFPASLPFFFVSSMKTVYTAPPAGRGHGEIDLTAARTCD